MHIAQLSWLQRSSGADVFANLTNFCMKMFPLSDKSKILKKAQKETIGRAEEEVRKELREGGDGEWRRGGEGQGDLPSTAVSLPAHTGLSPAFSQPWR